jgi:hypothetical protein
MEKFIYQSCALRLKAVLVISDCCFYPVSNIPRFMSGSLFTELANSHLLAGT